MLNLTKAIYAAEISNVANNGSGLIRITSTAHGLATGDTVFIYGVRGTTEANGTWVVTVLSSTEFTLDSSTYANAWLGDGGVYHGNRLVLSLAASDYDCSVVVSFRRNDQPYSVAYDVSAATTILLSADPDYGLEITSVNVFSKEASGDILATLQIQSKANTVFKFAFATINAGERWSCGPSVELMSADGRTAQTSVGAP